MHACISKRGPVHQSVHLPVLSLVMFKNYKRTHLLVEQVCRDRVLQSSGGAYIEVVLYIEYIDAPKDFGPKLTLTKF